MALNSLGLGFMFTAKDLASGPIRSLNRNLHATDRATVHANRNMAAGAAASRKMAAGMATGTVATGLLGASMGGLLMRLGPLVGGVALLGGAFNAADSAGNFQQQLVATQQIMGATNEELALLKERVLDVGLRTKFSPDEIVEGMKNMGAMGLKASEAINTIEPAALLATAGQIGLDDATRAIVGTIKSFKMESKEAGLVADKLAKATMLSNLQATDFANGFSKGAASMGIFGQSIEDSLVTMGLMRNMNIDSSSASTAMREGVRRVATDQRAMNAVTGAGVDIYDKQTGKMRGMGDIMLDLIDKGKDMTEAQRNALSVTVFGARGLLSYAGVANATFRVMRNGEEVLLKGREAFEAMKAEIAGAEGTVKRFNDALLDTFQGQKQILDGAVDTLKVVMGEGAASVLKPIVKLVADTVSQMALFIKDVSTESKELAAKMMLVGGVILTVLGAVVLFGSTFVTVVGLIGGAVYAFKKLVEHNIGGVGDVFRSVMQKTWLFMRGMTQIITDGFLSGDTLSELMEEENAGVLRTIGTLVQIGYRIQRFFEGLGEGAQELFRENAHIFEMFFDALKTLGREFGVTENGLEGLTSASDTWAERGKTVGRIIGQIVLGAVLAATFIIKFATAMIRAGKWIVDSWDRIASTIKLAGIVIGTVIASVIAVKYGAIAVTFLYEAAMIAGATAVWLATSAEVGHRLSLIASIAANYANLVAIKVVRAARALLLILTTRQAAAEALLTVRTWAGVAASKAAAVAQGGLGKAAKGLAGGMVGKLGLIGAAAMAGYAFGEWLNETFKLSDGLADLLGDVLGLNDAMKNMTYLDKDGNVVKVGEAYQNKPGTVGRGGVKFLGETPGAAFATTAPKASVTGGIPSQGLGVSGLDQATMQELASAEREMAAALKQSGANPPNVALYVDSEKIAEAVQRGTASNSARGFGE